MSSARRSHATPAEALAAILARIDAARKSAVAPAPSTTLIAVSKTHGEERIRPLLEAGQRVFGENRVQEAKAKWPALKADYPDVELHLIGPLQSNKTAEAVALFDCIHSLDRPKLAHALAAEMEKTGKRVPLFIQVNTGAEAAEGRDRARRRGGVHRAVPRRIEIAGRRADVHSAGRARIRRRILRCWPSSRARTACPVSAWA